MDRVSRDKFRELKLENSEIRSIIDSYPVYIKGIDALQSSFSFRKKISSNSD